jgi:hypothetical protein
MITELRLTVALTVLLAEGTVAALVVPIREDLEDERRPGQEQQQHGLEAVRGDQKVGVGQVVREHARRPASGVHQHLRMVGLTGVLLA